MSKCEKVGNMWIHKQFWRDNNPFGLSWFRVILGAAMDDRMWPNCPRHRGELVPGPDLMRYKNQFNQIGAAANSTACCPKGGW